MKYVALVLLALTTNLAAQSPVKATYAYSRTTAPGIPSETRGAPSAQGPFPTTYFIYVVVKKGTRISATGVCIEGKHSPAALKKVESPVVVEHDTSVRTGGKDTLVPKTADDVYQVDLQQAASQPCDLPKQDKLAKDNAVVVCLKEGQSKWYALAKKIVSLTPAAAP